MNLSVRDEATKKEGTVEYKKKAARMASEQLKQLEEWMDREEGGVDRRQVS